MLKNEIQLLMANIKRQQFLSRLLRISQLNQELVEVCNKANKQPAFTKKIQLLKMNHFNIKLPQNKRNDDARHGSKIMIVSHPECQMRQYNSTKKMQISEISKNSINAIAVSTEIASGSRKLSQSNNRIIIQKKRPSLKQQQTKDKMANYVNIISSEIKNSSQNKQSLISKRILHKRQSLMIKNSIKQSYRQYSIANKYQKQVNLQVNPEKIDNIQKQSNNLINQQQKLIIKNNKFSKQQLNQHLNIYLNPQSIIKSCEKRQKYFKSMNHISYLSQQKNLEEEKKNKLIFIKQINKNYGKPFHPPPKITAKSYIICQIKQNEENLKVIVSFNSKTSQEVASLTKIMTCIVIIEFCEKYFIDVDKQVIKIGKYESSIGGTTAQLKQGQIFTLIQLLYGLMLPSGNDASLALAVWCGRKLLYLDKQQKLLIDYRYQSSINSKVNTYSISCQSTMDGQKFLKSECYIRFIKEMNQKAKVLQLSKTHYSNSHGLMNPNNRSTAYDIAILSKYALNNQLFREIVNCKSYQAKIKYIQNQEIKQSAEKQYRQINDDQNDYDYQHSLDYEDKQINQSKIKRPATAIALSRPMSPSLVKEKQIKFVAVQKQMTICWKNTHKLLQNKSQQYLGIKTGFTTNAGACLSSLILLQGRRFIIIVLSCGKMSLRFKQTQALKKWLCKHQNIGRVQKKIINIQLQNNSQFVQNGQNGQNDQYLQQDEKAQ